MPDYINRAEVEQKLSRIVGRGMRSELRKLLDYLGDPPDLTRVPPEYWQNGWRGIQREVEPVLLDVFLTQAEGMMLGIGIGIDVDKVNRVAVNWARTHTENVLMEMWRNRHGETADLLTRYVGVGEAVAEGYEQGLTIREVSERLERLYSPVRAEMLAVTETTRAVVEGERAFVAQLEAESGQRMVPIWMTANDDRVCLICGPRNEKPITNGEYPPAHPRCRCGVGYEFEVKS
jgi:hypothetical protein